MEIKQYHPSEQIDPAVDLGLIPPPLPEIEFIGDFIANAPPAPEQIIDGILHRGCKMILGGTSKSNKSWCLLDLALSVASGQPWWGRKTSRSKVVYINFELHRWSIASRLNALATARPECTGIRENLALWNLRGRNTDISLLRPELERELAKHDFGLIILDPAYKLLGGRDENSNGEIANLMNEFESLAQASGAAVVLAHHYAKGDSSAKSALDRMSGAGAWARDPDSIMVLTPHEEPDCFTVNSILRNLPKIDEFAVEWDYPTMKLAPDLDPDAIKRPQSKNKLCTDKEFIDALLGSEGKTFNRIVEEAHSTFKMSRKSVARRLKRFKQKGLLIHNDGLYYVPTGAGVTPSDTCDTSGDT